VGGPRERSGPPASLAARHLISHAQERDGASGSAKCAWSYARDTGPIREFMRRGVVIRTVINNFTFDGAAKDPMQQAVRDALIGFMAATARAQAEATKAAQRAGIERAKQNDERAYLGRKPSFTREQLAKVRDMLGQEAVGIAQIAKETGLSRQTIYRIKDDPAGAEGALVAWERR
jgi:putative DNA-invertase from lambdoid prophage Rac